MSEFIIAGVFMWPLLACSVLIISITIERLWFLQSRLVSPNGLKNQIINLYNKVYSIKDNLKKFPSYHLLAIY